MRYSAEKRTVKTLGAERREKPQARDAGLGVAGDWAKAAERLGRFIA
jgi:hypothetical protein